MPDTEERVRIVVSAKDEATKTMTGIGHGISTALGTFAGGAALGLATKGFDALWGAVSGGISDARDANQVFAQTQAVIKSTGGAAGFTAEQIADMAGSLSAASGKSLFGDDDIQRGQNMLLTFTNIKETLPDATATMLDMAQALGTDAGGAAVQLGKALNDPIAGISALSRVGVTFTDQQKAQIETMVKAGDVAGAQGVILAELNKEFGGSAAAAAAADGGIAQLKDTLGEMAEGAGAAALPFLNDITAGLNDMLQAFNEGGLSGLWATVKPKLDEFGSEALAWIQAQAPIWAQNLVGWGKAFWQWVVDAVPPLLEQLGVVASKMIAWILAELPGWTTQLKAFGAAAIQWVLDALPGLAANLGTFAGKVIAWILQTAIDVVPVLAKLGFKFLAWVVTDVLPELPGFLAKILAAILTFIGSAATEIVPQLKLMASKFLTWVDTDVTPFLSAKMETIKTTILGWISGARSWAATALTSIGTAIVQSLIDGINSMIGRARAVLNEIIGIINSIPGIPDVPAGKGGSGSSGFGGARALGGPVFSGMSYLVGEHGPELFVPRSSGQIVAGATYSISIDARGASDPAAVERAGYVGAKRALQETGNLLSELRSGGRS